MFKSSRGFILRPWPPSTRFLTISHLNLVYSTIIVGLGLILPLRGRLGRCFKSIPYCVLCQNRSIGPFSAIVSILDVQICYFLREPRDVLFAHERNVQKPGAISIKYELYHKATLKPSSLLSFGLWNHPQHDK